jgi:hypothetical protein
MITSSNLNQIAKPLKFILSAITFNHPLREIGWGFLLGKIAGYYDKSSVLNIITKL